MKIIFLDFDGVVNHQRFYTDTSFEFRNSERERLNDEWGEAFCQESTSLYNLLTEKTGAKTVISSSKRHIAGDFEYMKRMWVNRGFIGELIGITPFLTFKQTYNSVPRGCEIAVWLEEHNFSLINWSKEDQEESIKKSGIENFIIIDDDDDSLYSQRNHFIHVEDTEVHRTGFDQKYYEIALEKLSKTVIELNYNG